VAQDVLTDLSKVRNNGTSTTLPQLMAQGYNTTSVGVSNGAHSAGFTTVAGPGRIKPDLVAPATVTSNATPIVSSAALLLRATAATAADLSLATDPRTLKALLLASASKYKYSTWTQTATRPLDLRYGAGELNIYNAHRLLTVGRRAFSPTTLHPARGWDRATTTNPTTGRTYKFDVPNDNTASRFAAALAWHRTTTVVAQSLNVSLADLTLRLHPVTGTTVGTALAESASPVDNVEHLYPPDLAPGRYALVVTSPTNNVPYALAWFTAPTVALTTTAPPHAPRDLGTPLTFSFTRAGGDLSLPLTVPLASTGNGLFTTTVPTTITFAPHETQTALHLTPLPAADATTPPATFTLELPATDFASAPSAIASTVTLTLHARSYAAWLATHFTPAQLADPALSGDPADPDADGLPNLLEYAFARAPFTPDSAADHHPAAALDAQGRPTLTYFHAAHRPDHTYAVQWSRDLAAPWSTSPAHVTEIARTPTSGGELVTVTAVPLPDAEPRQFLRLHVTRH
jgi:hypothetical protein